MTAKATDYQQANRDMRRDRRFQVSQAAIITQPGHPEIACEIRDFCQGGLFLKFTSPEAAIASLAKRTDAEVEIVFTPASAHATQTFRVPAQLKRLSPLGVGVVFVRQPVDALRALQKLRMAGHRQKLAALPASDAHPHLREASTTLLSETLLQVHDEMVRVLGDKLSAAALHASGIAEHRGTALPACWASDEVASQSSNASSSTSSSPPSRVSRVARVRTGRACFSASITCCTKWL
jgi:hypothetical protein